VRQSLARSHKHIRFEEEVSLGQKPVAWIQLNIARLWRKYNLVNFSCWIESAEGLIAEWELNSYRRSCQNWTELLADNSKRMIWLTTTSIVLWPYCRTCMALKLIRHLLPFIGCRISRCLRRMIACRTAAVPGVFVVVQFSLALTQPVPVSSIIINYWNLNEMPNVYVFRT
jgi:hypothetical protein